ncbi:MULTISPECIES: hypothetical protein [unclassified Cobetia]|uniref:hypothetical protein n=1 Tax=Cobetia sp. 2AS TaxID=3040017 RepID=UPI001CF0A9DA|nr:MULTISPECIES: hypothetical protein [unclassified Cobetia]MDH2447032.1 hypothetical protein [Cobetia sp. 2AS]
MVRHHAGIHLVAGVDVHGDLGVLDAEAQQAGEQPVLGDGMRCQHADGVRMLERAQALSGHLEPLQRRENVLLVEHSHLGERDTARLAHEQRRAK